MLQMLLWRHRSHEQAPLLCRWSAMRRKEYRSMRARWRKVSAARLPLPKMKSNCVTFGF
jgi:hypothetical protein